MERTNGKWTFIIFGPRSVAYDLQNRLNMARVLAIATTYFVLAAGVPFFGAANAKPPPTQVQLSNSICRDAQNIASGGLLVLDLDGTVWTEPQQLGRDHWHDLYLQRMLRSETKLRRARQRLHELTVEIKNASQVQLTETCLPKTIRELRERDVTVVIVTGRPPSMTERTLKRLQNFGIQVDASYFLAGGDKGVALRRVFDSLPKTPSMIQIYDDQQKNVHSYDTALTELGTIATVYHYLVPTRFSDEEQIRIAAIQLTDFLARGKRGPIMSDADAYRRLTGGKDICQHDLN